VNPPVIGESNCPGARVLLHQMLHAMVAGSKRRKVKPSKGAPSDGSGT